jgi:hypothetical protein
MHFAGDSLICIYQAVGPTQRAGQWLQLLHSGDPDLQIRAAAVLAVAGKPEAIEVFCERASPELVARMPPSEGVLKHIVRLIVQESPLIIHDHFSGPDGHDLREDLIRALTTKYTKEDLRPYAAQLLRWAENRDEPWAKDLRQFLKEETGTSGGAP